MHGTLSKKIVNGKEKHMSGYTNMTAYKIVSVGKQCVY